MAPNLASILLILACALTLGKSQPESSIALNSSISTTGRTRWLSPTGRFAFGFYPYGGGFAIGAWLVANTTTVIWTANRDDEPISRGAELQLTTEGLKLLQSNGDRIISNFSGDSPDASSASMLDSGNFAIYDYSSKTLWQTFDYPTDTLMAGQSLLANNELVSRLSETNRTTGRFRLKMQSDENLVMYPVETTDTRENAYWASDSKGKRFTSLRLSNSGSLDLIADDHSTYSLNFAQSTADPSVIYFARLEPDGIFRLYSFDGKRSDLLYEIPHGVNDKCQINGACGVNSYCNFTLGRVSCLCLPGFNYIDAGRTFAGCQRNFTEEGCLIRRDNIAYSMSMLENTTWLDDPYEDSSSVESKEECRDRCLHDCDCFAALFQGGECSKQRPPFRYEGISSGSVAFLKVGTGGPPRIPPRITIIEREPSSEFLMLIVALAGGLPVVVAPIVFFIRRKRIGRYQKLWENMEISLAEGMAPRSFSYRELKKATDDFREELGRGGFGAVFKGTLPKGEITIAVKRLEKVVEKGEREFRTEMRVIGRTHHRNLVRLLGFCYQRSKRLLVYEFMSNGSLADLIFKPERRPGWAERVSMAFDVARGIHYLHEECEAPIIHCDIKPQNILMDRDWTAKISDFGLAKLLMPSQTRAVTQRRGTGWYIAPEWDTNAPITVKVDVYSFGLVLLEIVCCRKNMEFEVEADEIFLTQWAYKCLLAGELEKLVRGEEVKMEELERMVKVGLCCIRPEPATRPSMKDVVIMLEGNKEVPLPPTPAAF